MRRRGEHSPLFVLFENPVIIGVVTVLVTMLGIYLAYTANRGLPFVPTYRLDADVPDAAELTLGSEVRIGGARVGQVVRITAMPGRHPYARLQLELQPKTGRVPADSTVTIRPRSILGAKYVALTRGSSRHKLPDGSTLSLAHAKDTVELSDAFGIFDRKTQRGIQGTVIGLGDSLAGRGPDLNVSVEAFGRLLGPAERVARTLADPGTGLSSFISGLASFTGALAPRAAQLGSLFDHAATTLAAVDRGRAGLERSLELLPPTEIAAGRALRQATPALRDAARLIRALEPGARLLPVASQRLDVTLRTATPVLRRGPGLADRLGATFAALGDLARDPNAARSVRKLITTVRSLDVTLQTLVPAQTVCNVTGLWARNVPSVVSDGDTEGAWLSFISVLATDQSPQAATPTASLHATPAPTENAMECEAGNEPYKDGQHIGHAAGRQPTRTDTTSRPAGVGTG